MITRRNIYRHQFKSVCPVNGDLIEYHLTIEAQKTIEAEHIEKACRGHVSAFHEDIADVIHAHFGGLQILRATHGAVAIETIRGEL